jgi:WD40 repeat protein
MTSDREPADVLVSATGSVRRLAFSPDGSLLAAAREYAVEVRDGVTGHPLRVLAGHTGDVRSVAFAPDGRRLASASFDHTVRIWDAPTGEILRTVAVNYPGGVRFSPDGARLAVASWSAGVLLLDETGAAAPLTPGARRTMVDSVVFAPGGDLLAVLDTQNRCVVYEVSTGATRLRLPGRGLRDRLRGRRDGNRLIEVDFTADGSALAGVTRDGAIHVWDLATGRPRTSVPPPKPRRRVEVAVFLPGAARVVAAPGRVVRDFAVRDVATGAVLDKLDGDGLPTALAVNADGRRLAGGTSEGSLHLWPGPEGDAVTLPDRAYNPLWDVAYSPDGRFLATVSNNGDAVVWEVATGRMHATYPGDLHRRVAIAFGPDGTVAVAGPFLAPQSREPAGDRVRLTLDRPVGETQALALSADGRRLVTLDKDDRVRVWDATTGALLHVAESRGDRVRFTPDGATIAVISGYGVRMWTPPAHRMTTLFPASEARPHVTRAIAFSPDGQLTAAPYDLDAVVIWGPATGRAPRILPNQGYVYALEFSPYGGLLAIAPFDGAPRIHDAATGAVRHTLTGHLNGAHALAFAPDGTSLVTASVDGAARIWNTATGALRATLIPPPGDR